MAKSKITEKNRLVGTTYLAGIAGKSPKTIRLWAKQGKLPHYKTSQTSISFPLEECLQIMEGFRVDVARKS